jgi:mannose-6-phosphate isomerase-like protein (cupin superfamily)
MIETSPSRSSTARPPGPQSLYERWKLAEGLPTIRGFFIRNVLDVELTPWESRGGSGVFINLDGSEGINDSFIHELPPRGSSTPIKHMYDETIYVLQGQGATTVWLDEGKKQTFEWHTSSFFAIPPNAWYQHFNLSADEPARFYGMTSAPLVMDAFKSLDFVFNNPYVFADRFNGEDNYFTQTERLGDGGYRTNFVADVLASSIMGGTAGYDDSRGPGARGTRFNLVNSTRRNHSSSWPVGTYKMAHRHGPGINILILRGEGYSLMWLPGQPVQRFDWGPGSVVVPGEGWYHQHFNTSAEPVLFLAIGSGNEKPRAGGGGWAASGAGEDQIELEDEDPAIHRDFEADLAKNGVRCRMGDAHPLCTAR